MPHARLIPENMWNWTSTRGERGNRLEFSCVRREKYNSLATAGDPGLGRARKSWGWRLLHICGRTGSCRTRNRERPAARVRKRMEAHGYCIVNCFDMRLLLATIIIIAMVSHSHPHFYCGTPALYKTVPSSNNRRGSHVELD